MTAPEATARKWLPLAVRLSVAVVIYYFIFQKVPLPNLRTLIQPALIYAFAIAIALNMLQAVLCTVRWRLVAADSPNVPGFSRSFAAYMEGLFFNQALPSFIGGDAVRVIRWRACNVKAGDALLSVFRDRLFGAIGAASFAMLACFLLWDQPIERYLNLSLLALSGAVIGGCVIVLSLSQWPGLSSLFSRIRSIHSLAIGLAARPLDRTMIWKSLGITMVAQLLPGISVFILAKALLIAMSFPIAISVTGAILLISMIPISLAGWGVREAGFLLILGPLGASTESTLLLGVFFGLAGLCGALPGGLSITLGLSAPATQTSLVQAHEAE